MEILFKYCSGALAALASMLLPITPLVTTALVFIIVDFVTGIMASRAEALRANKPWRIESRKAWRTVLKAGFTAIAIVMMWVVDHVLLDFMHLNLANLFTGFVCGVELWSFLENAARISNAPLFEWLSRWLKARIGKEANNE